MPDNMTLSVLHAGRKELTVMRSLLNLAGSEPSWAVIDQPGGQYTVVDVDSPEGAEMWGSLERKDVIALTRQPDFPADLKLRKPLRSREFLELLTQLSSGDITSDDADVVEIDDDSAVAWESWDLQDERYPLAEHLRRGTWSTPVLLNEQGWPELIIDPGSGTWYYDGAISDMTPVMFAQPITESAGIALGSEDMVERTAGMHQRPLSELKWFAGLVQSRGRLHPDLVGQYEFMLTQVPPQAIDNPRFQGLAQALIRAPIGIDELHGQSGEAVETVAAFLNACYTTGRLLINQSARAVSF
jgi:hypothetical protein